MFNPKRDEAYWKWRAEESWQENILVTHNSDLYDEDVDEDTEPIRKVSSQTRYEVLKAQHWKCNDCGCILKYCRDSSWKGEVAHIDHIHPFSEWRTYQGWDINERSNLQALCPKCNQQKSKKKVSDGKQ